MSPLVRIEPAQFDVDIALAYATPDNFTATPVYAAEAGCFLNAEAAPLLARAVALARPLGLKLKLLDAFRPTEAQWILWNHTPDPGFLADPRRGSPHSRGAAIDLTLVRRDDATELDMGTAFDAFTPLSHHGNPGIPAEAQRNRLVLMGLMTTAGWDFYGNEWWHYQLFDPRRHPLLSDSVLGPARMMP
jgi:D-alanyl-D-alanine dipeptidase